MYSTCKRLTLIEYLLNTVQSGGLSEGVVISGIVWISSTPLVSLSYLLFVFVAIPPDCSQHATYDGVHRGGDGAGTATSGSAK